MATISELSASDMAVAMDDFGEEVVYRPRSGRPRVINAIVDRSPEAKVGGIPDTKAPVIHLTVRNSATAGISSSDDVTASQIDVAMRVGQDAETRSIARIVRHDDAAMTIEVR